MLFRASSTRRAAPSGSLEPGLLPLDGQKSPVVARKPVQNEKNLRENEAEAQPSTGDCVEQGMATLVLDRAGFESAEGIEPGSLTGSSMAQRAAEGDQDAQLMLRAANGDENSFSLLVARYHRPILHFLFRMVHSQAVAEELAQEVFLRVYRARQSYRAEARFSTWLYRIATNLAVNHARDTRHEREAGRVSLDEPDEETGTRPELPSGERSVEDKLVRDERMRAIRAQVMALPERQRMAVLMHKYQEMDYRQIGEVLKLSESATKSLLFRAYQTLRTTLKDFA